MLVALSIIAFEYTYQCYCIRLYPIWFDLRHDSHMFHVNVLCYSKFQPMNAALERFRSLSILSLSVVLKETKFGENSFFREMKK